MRDGAIDSLLQRTHPAPTSPRYNRPAVAQAASIMASRTLFEVDVSQTGGEAGDRSTQCSYTYSVRLPGASVNLATDIAPQRARPSLGKMKRIAGDPYWGLGWAYIDAAGRLRLWDANETLDSSSCVYG